MDDGTNNGYEGSDKIFEAVELDYFLGVLCHHLIEFAFEVPNFCFEFLFLLDHVFEALDFSINFLELLIISAFFVLHTLFKISAEVLQVFAVLIDIGLYLGESFEILCLLPLHLLSLLKIKFLNLNVLLPELEIVSIFIV